MNEKMQFRVRTSGVAFDLEIDLKWLAQQLAAKALHNKSKATATLNGAIKMRRAK